MQLATTVLDPVIDYFGGIKLTYGFASPALTRHINGRIAPKLDQHAACEVNRRGAPRLFATRRSRRLPGRVRRHARGRALDRRELLHSARMYLYGGDRPLHVSIDDANAGEIFEMKMHGERRVPRRIRL